MDDVNAIPVDWVERVRALQDALALAQVDVWRLKKAVRNHRCVRETREGPE